MADKNITFCSRCQGEFNNKGAATKTSCPYCGYANVVVVHVAGQGGTLRTADSDVDATAATGATVT